MTNDFLAQLIDELLGATTEARVIQLIESLESMSERSAAADVALGRAKYGSDSKTLDEWLHTQSQNYAAYRPK